MHSKLRFARGGEPSQIHRAGGSGSHQETTGPGSLDLSLGSVEVKAYCAGGVSEALLTFRTAVRPTAVLAPRSHASLPGGWHWVDARPRRSPSVAE